MEQNDLVPKKNKPGPKPKNADKQVRPPIEEGVQDSKKVYNEFGRTQRMDTTMYERKYPNMKLMKINQLDGDIEKWLEAGAEPVPRISGGAQNYPGLNDKKENDWVKWHGGTAEGGKAFDVYLLMMDPDAYEQYKINPLKARQADINKKLKGGDNQSGIDGGLVGGGAIKTYAAELPDGSGRGFNEVR